MPEGSVPMNRQDADTPLLSTLSPHLKASSDLIGYARGVVIAVGGQTWTAFEHLLAESSVSRHSAAMATDGCTPWVTSSATTASVSATRPGEKPSHSSRTT